MADMASRERDVGRGHVDVFEESLIRLAEARAAVAAVLGTDVDAVALTHSTTDAMNAGSLALDWRAGGRVVTTRSEHPGGLGAFYALRERGVEIAFVDAGDDGDDARTLEAFDAAITPGTRLVALSHVQWTTGAVLPVADIATLAHARGALVIVDGAQAAGAIPFRFDELGVDLYALSAQKWLLGPEGMGALVVAPDLVERLVPAMGGGFSFERSDSDGEGGLVARCPPLRGVQLPRPVRGRDGPVAWLAVDVCRARLHPSPRDGHGTSGGRPACRDRRGDAPHAGRADGDPGGIPDRRLAGRGGAG